MGATDAIGTAFDPHKARWAGLGRAEPAKSARASNQWASTLSPPVGSSSSRAEEHAPFRVPRIDRSIN